MVRVAVAMSMWLARTMSFEGASTVQAETVLWESGESAIVVTWSTVAAPSYNFRKPLVQFSYCPIRIGYSSCSKTVLALSILVKWGVKWKMGNVRREYRLQETQTKRKNFLPLRGTWNCDLMNLSQKWESLSSALFCESSAVKVLQIS